MSTQPTTPRFLIDEGEKIHVAARRGFDGDIRRHFVGVVTRASENAVRGDGHTFIFDNVKGQFTRRPETRTRIISLLDANLVIKVIPISTDVASIRYGMSSERRLIMTDDSEFTMDIEEYNFKQG